VKDGSFFVLNERQEDKILVLIKLAYCSFCSLFSLFGNYEPKIYGVVSGHPLELQFKGRYFLLEANISVFFFTWKG